MDADTNHRVRFIQIHCPHSRADAPPFSHSGACLQTLKQTVYQFGRDAPLCQRRGDRVATRRRVKRLIAAAWRMQQNAVEIEMKCWKNDASSCDNLITAKASSSSVLGWIVGWLRWGAWAEAREARGFLSLTGILLLGRLPAKLMEFCSACRHIHRSQPVSKSTRVICMGKFFLFQIWTNQEILRMLIFFQKITHFYHQ